MAFLVATVSVGCDDGIVGPEPPPNVEAWVTGAARAALDANGHFRLPPAPIDSVRMIDVETATGVARAYARLTRPGTGRAERLEDAHGAPIPFETVDTCGRVFWTVSAYEPLPDTVPAWIRRTAGHYHSVHLCTDRTVALSVAVSAYAVGLHVHEDGRLHFPEDGGEELRIVGVPRRSAPTRPMSPEHAVRIAAEATDALIAEVPVLVGPKRSVIPQAARWHLALDRTIRVRPVEDGHTVDATTIYVDSFGELAYPTPSQPSVDSAYTLTGEYEIRRKPDVPVEFQPVEIVS